MRHFVACILFTVFFSLTAFCKPSANAGDTIGTSPAVSHLRISLLTCSPGEELWETFGHTCIRVIDSTKTKGLRDVIYNYGFFEVSDGNSIAHQFLTGRVMVILDTITYDELMYEYRIKKREIVEQEFLLNDEQKLRLLAFLKNNLKKENRYYEYDTFYDNCTTRALRMFSAVFGKSFVAGQVIPVQSRITFRDVTADLYCTYQHKYWLGLGLNLFYASKADKVMTNTDAMFLADFFCDGMVNATIDGKKVCAPKFVIQGDNVQWSSDIDGPLFVFLALALLTIASLLYTAKPFVGNIVGSLVVMATGMLGFVIIYLWHLDGEPAWKTNFNVLWALPTNLFFPFLRPAFKARYSAVALLLIGVAFFVDIFRIQVIPLSQITPLFLALIWIYTFSLRKITTER